MGLSVETPTPPDLTNRPLPSDIDPDEVDERMGDLRSGELEQLLKDGAWNEAFEEWAEYSDLTEPEYRGLEDAGLFELLDFYWHPGSDELRFEVPSVEAGLTRTEAFDSRMRGELTDLGRTVVELLETEYVDWGADGTSEDIWTEESFDEDTDPE